MKSQPALLASSVANFALLIFIFYALHAAGKFRETLMNQVFQNTSTIHDILKQRAVACPEQRTGLDLPLKSVEITVEPLKPIEPVNADHSD